ncbi:MAG: hypothetical protein HXY38_00695 [Chloroflexi bacterium]|nr:hypothetical protein [Chloroflexota bacterium]
MTLLLSFTALLPRIFLGFFIVHSIWNARDGKSLLVKIFLSAGAGFGISSLLGFLWIWAGLPLTVYAWVESIVAIILMVWLLVQNRRLLRMPQISVKQELLWSSILAAGVLFFLLNLMLYGLQYPHGRPDAWINWNVVARFIHLGGADWQATFLRQFDHPDYPLYLPMTNAITWTLIREPSTWGAIAFHFVNTFFTAGLLFSFINRFRDFKQAALATVIFISLPFTIGQGMRQYADMLLAQLILAAGGLTLLYLQTKENRLAILTGLVIGLAGWAKNEGLIAILVLTLLWVVLTVKKEKQALWKYFAGLAFPLLVVILFKLFLAPSNDLLAGQGNLLEKVLEVERYRIIAKHAFTTLWGLGDAPVSLFGIIILTAIILGRSNRGIPGLWFIPALIGILLTAYFGTYLLTPQDLSWHLNTSLDRLYLHLFPLALLWFLLWLKSPQELLSKES